MENYLLTTIVLLAYVTSIALYAKKVEGKKA